MQMIHNSLALFKVWFSELSPTQYWPKCALMTNIKNWIEAFTKTNNYLLELFAYFILVLYVFTKVFLSSNQLNDGSVGLLQCYEYCPNHNLLNWPWTDIGIHWNTIFTKFMILQIAILQTSFNIHWMIDVC